MTTRRAFLGTLAGGLLAAPAATAAQKSEKIARLGILGIGSAPSPQEFAWSRTPGWVMLPAPCPGCSFPSFRHLAHLA